MVIILFFYRLLLLFISLFFYNLMFIPNKRGRNYKIPIVFEFGSLNTRAGFAGKDSPDVILPTDFLVDADGS